MTRAFASVLIDTYNHERFIEKAIVSVLEQDFPAGEREIIVVDDGSTDGTREIVRKFEPRVRLLEKKNGGQASAFNAGIPECRGEIVAFLDGDDWWAGKKLTRVAETMAGDATIGIVGHGLVVVERDGSERNEILLDGFRFEAGTMEGARLFQRRGAFLGTSRMTIRSELLRRIGRVPEEIKIQADEYLFTMASVLAGTEILPEALTYYRLHEENSFELAGHDVEKSRRKQRSLAALVKRLTHELEKLGIDPQVRRTLMEFTHTSAERLRLVVDGGWPWETVKTEWKMYEILHPDARVSHRAFKMMTLVAAMVTTPKGFYRAQRALAQNKMYLRARKRWLPVPEMQHIQKDSRARP